MASDWKAPSSSYALGGIMYMFATFPMSWDMFSTQIERSEFKYTIFLKVAKFSLSYKGSQ